MAAVQWLQQVKDKSDIKVEYIGVKGDSLKKV